MLEKVSFHVNGWSYIWDHKKNIFFAANEIIKEYFQGTPEEDSGIDFNQIVQKIESSKIIDPNLEKLKIMNEAREKLKTFINTSKQDIYKKQEIVSLGYENQQSVDNKKSTYKQQYDLLKADYEAKKIAAGV